MNGTDTASTFVAYSVGLCYASVCTTLSNEDATYQLNWERPTGVTPWAIADEPFADGTPNPSPCDRGGQARHILFVC